jgi:prepilin-type N-terminal cleavage/methylation domain-containing protein
MAMRLMLGRRDGVLRLRGSRPGGAVGFTLIEMSVVLLIVTLLLGGLLLPLATQVEQRQAAETQRMLDDAREALIGFAMVNGRLPRPAVSVTNGAENGATCGSNAVPVAACTGFLPWATLGLPRFDGYGKQLRYSVAPAFADSTITFSSSTANHKTVTTRDSAGTVINLVSGVPAVILSHGAKNFGFGDSGNEFTNASTTNTDEQANDVKFKCTVATDCTDFVSRTRSGNTGAAGGEFDDLVSWVPNTLLINRLVAAGRLP